jgi:hypothetical protein
MSNDHVVSSVYESQSLDPKVTLTSIPTLDVASLIVTTDDIDPMLNPRKSDQEDTGFLSSDLNLHTSDHGEHILAPSDLAEAWNGFIDDDLFPDGSMGNLELDNDMFLTPPHSEPASARVLVDQAIDETSGCDDSLHQYLEAYVPSNTSSIAQSDYNSMISLDELQNSSSTVRSTSLPFMVSPDSQPGFMLQTPRSQNSQGKQTMMEDAGSLRRPATSTSTPGSWSQFLHDITSPSRDCRKRTNPVDTPQCASGRHGGYHDHGHPQSLRSMPCKCSRSHQSDIQSSSHLTETHRELDRAASLPKMPEEKMSSMQLLKLSARFARLAHPQRHRERLALSCRPKLRASDWSRPYDHRPPRVDRCSHEDGELLDYLAAEASSLENQDDLLIQLMNSRRQRSWLLVWSSMVSNHIAAGLNGGSRRRSTITWESEVNRGVPAAWCMHIDYRDHCPE